MKGVHPIESIDLIQESLAQQATFLEYQKKIGQLQETIQQLRVNLDEKEVQRRQDCLAIETLKNHEIEALKATIQVLRNHLEVNQIAAEKAASEIKNQLSREIEMCHDMIAELRSKLERGHEKK